MKFIKEKENECEDLIIEYSLKIKTA